MTHVETRTLSYAFAASLAVHVLLLVSFALWIGVGSLPRLPVPHVVEPQPTVTLVFPMSAPPVPTPPKKEERYIRTTQNTESEKAPANPAFVSDKNTVASSKAAPSPDGNKPLPTMKGADFPSTELADRTFQDGDTKNDSAPVPPNASAAVAVMKPAPPPSPPTPPAPTPKAKPPEPAPPPLIVKKEDAPAEKMMKELDATLAKQDKPIEPKPQDQPPDMEKKAEPVKALPLMRNPEEASVPSPIPVATPVANTPKPEKNAFQPETRRGATKGTISNVGKEDAVDAAVTPVGRYMRQVTSAVEKKWHQYRLARADAVEPGKMGLRFFVNKNGKVEDLEFLFKESNPMMEDFTIEAILKADIPPIPKDLLPILEKERVEITYDIVIHP